MLENNGRTLKVVMEGVVVEVVSSDRVTPAPMSSMPDVSETDDVGESRKATPACRENDNVAQGAENDDGREWIVEHITAHGYDEEKKLLVLVKWKGYPPSWHYAADRHHDNLISRYLRKVKKNADVLMDPKSSERSSPATRTVRRSPRLRGAAST